MTQIEFAVRLSLSATSIHRYEVGAGIPNTQAVQKLHAYALERRNSWAEHRFFQELMAGAGLDPNEFGPPPPLDSDLKRKALGLIEIEGQALAEREKLLAVALVLWLRNVPDQTAEKVLNVILEPWLDRARQEIEKQVPEEKQLPYKFVRGPY
jgi:hypothetical protein